MVLVNAVGVAGRSRGFRVLSDTESTALGEEITSAQGQEINALKHGLEIGAGGQQRVLQGIIVDRLHADGGEISGLTGQILRHALHIQAQGIAILNVSLMLRGSDPVVRGQVSDLTALGVHPAQTLPDMDGVGQAIIRDLIAGSQMGGQLRHKQRGNHRTG